MRCDKCGKEIQAGQEQLWKLSHLCEDCYVEAVDLGLSSDTWKTLKDQHGKPE